MILAISCSFGHWHHLHIVYSSLFNHSCLIICSFFTEFGDQLLFSIIHVCSFVHFSARMAISCPLNNSILMNCLFFSDGGDQLLFSTIHVCSFVHFSVRVAISLRRSRWMGRCRLMLRPKVYSQNLTSFPAIKAQVWLTVWICSFCTRMIIFWQMNFVYAGMEMQKRPVAPILMGGLASNYIATIWHKRRKWH